MLEETGVARPRRRPAERDARLRRPCERFKASLRDAMAGAVVCRRKREDGAGGKGMSGLM